MFGGVRAPATLGQFLRCFTFGHVRQFDAVASRALVNLAAEVPGLLAGGDGLVFLDVDDTVKAVYGAKQGAGHGYTRVKGLNAQIAITSTAGAAPVITSARLRRRGRGLRPRGDADHPRRDRGHPPRRGHRADPGPHGQRLLLAIRGLCPLLGSVGLAID